MSIEICYTIGMKLPKNPFLRKLFVLPFLVIAGLLIGDVYQRITMTTPEDILLALGARQALTQTMTVNGRQVIADIWHLPEAASSASLRKLKAKIITVGREVYVFHDELDSLRGKCDYPSDLPTWNITPHYVIDAAHTRFISGSSQQAPDQLLNAFATSATAAGWKSLNNHLWQKGDQTLFVHAVEGEANTHAMIAIRKELP